MRERIRQTGKQREERDRHTGRQAGRKRERESIL